MKKTKKRTLNSLIKKEIAQVIPENFPELTVFLSNAQQKKLEEYCSVLGVSVRSALNSCLQYVLWLSDQTGVKPHDMPGYPKYSGFNECTVVLNAETLAKIQQFEVQDTDELAKYVVLGLKLLYKNNFQAQNLLKTKALSDSTVNFRVCYKEFDSVGFWLLDKNFSRSTFSDFNIPKGAAKDEAIAKAFYEDLAQRFHPDRGGTNEQMSNLSKLYDQIMALVEVNEIKPKKEH